MLFTPKLIAISKENDTRVVNNLAGILGQPIHIIPRANCAFRRYRLKGSGKLAMQAVMLRAKNEARSDHDKFKIFKDPDNKNATVWSYNSKNISHVRSLPETLCLNPLSSGSRLVTCFLGLEGQVWDNGVLVASRWWHQNPSAEEWASFIRVAPLEFEPGAFKMPATEIVEYNNNLPLIAFDKYKLEDVIPPKKVSLLASIIALFVLSFTSTKYFHYSTQLSNIESQKTEISAEANIILSKRRRTLANISRIQKYKETTPRRSLIATLGDLANTIQGQNVTIRDLNVKDNEIEIRVLGEVSTRSPELVAELEKTNSVADVSITNDRRNSLLIKAILTGDESTNINNISVSTP